jgi:hypothetical protein
MVFVRRNHYGGGVCEFQFSRLILSANNGGIDIVVRV